MVAGDGAAPDRVDQQQKAEEGKGETAVDEIHHLRAIERRLYGVLHPADGEVRLDGDQKAKNAQGKGATEQERNPWTHDRTRIRQEFDDFPAIIWAAKRGSAA
ncbi:MAG: hypothetical protein PVSMB9_06220 [Candidatus Dormibacteria bacterium]